MPVSVSEASRPRRDGGRVATARFDDEAVLYDVETTGLHLLNGTAALVWERCDGTRSVGRIAEELADLHGTDPPTVRSGVLAIVSELTSAGLLTEG